MDTPYHFLIVMGVSGSGKTTVGQQLAARLGWQFYDADDFHSAESIDKMANGIPLTDADRAPWLARLRELIVRCLKENHPGILACSALKDAYRQELTQGDEAIGIIFLKGDFDLIWSRMSSRSNHYMKPDMLASQFKALEEPKDAVVVTIDKKPGEICAEILAKIRSIQASTE